jgi:hypothetical protein
MELNLMYTLYGSRGSSGSIVSGYGLDNRAIVVRSPAESSDFSSNVCVQTGSGAHPASCTMGTGGPFLGGKARQGREADHSPDLMPRSWMSRSYILSPCASMGVLWDCFYKLYIVKTIKQGENGWVDFCGSGWDGRGRVGMLFFLIWSLYLACRKYSVFESFICRFSFAILCAWYLSRLFKHCPFLPLLLQS